MSRYLNRGFRIHINCTDIPEEEEMEYYRDDDETEDLDDGIEDFILEND